MVATVASEEGRRWRRRPILLPGDPCLLGDGVLQPSEYLGGVCDLVGEIGRHAVRKATERDADAVRASLATAVAVQSALLSLGPAAPRGLHKKGDGLRTSVRKMETLLYELSLVERSGRVREAPAEVPDAPPPEAARAATRIENGSQRDDRYQCRGCGMRRVTNWSANRIVNRKSKCSSGAVRCRE